MNVIVYFFMFIIGLIGAIVEINNHKTNKFYYRLFVLLFIILAMSRSIETLGGMRTGDLSSYIEAFQYDNDKYFEPGYVIFSVLVKTIFGKNPVVFVLLISCWFVFFTQLAIKYCNKSLNTKALANRGVKFEYSFRCTILFCIALYWGCFFTCETLRIGMATALLYLSTALFFANKRMAAVIFGAFAISFHYTTVIYLAVVIILFFLVKRLSRKFFLTIFVSIVGYEILSVDVFNVAGTLLQVLEADFFPHYATALDVTEDLALGGFSLNPQNIFYHLIGIIVLYGDLKNSNYNKAVQIYYVGLLLGALFSFTPLAMRMQWLFFSQICWIIYFFVADRHFISFRKINILLIYSVTQIVLIFRQFGGYF